MSVVETRSSTLNLSTTVRILLERRRMLASVSLGTALLLFALSFLLHNTFKATALVMPPDHSSSSALSMLSAAGGAASAMPTGALSALNLKNPSDLYVALMLSPLVEDAVIDRFHLASLYHQTHRSLVRRQLEGSTQVLADGKSGIISVSFTDTDPQRAADVANGLVEAFEQFSSQLAITDAGRRRLYFERQVAQTRATLNKDEDALRNTSAQTGVLEPEGTARALIGYEAQLREQLAAKTVELQSLKVYLSDDNPQVEVAEREVASLRQQADQLSEKNSAATSGYSNAGASTASLAYTRNLRDVKTDETLYELLLKNLEVAKLDEAREGNVIQVVSPATPPDLKNGPHRSFFLVGGFLLGLLAASIWALLDWARRSFAAAPRYDLQNATR